MPSPDRRHACALAFAALLVAGTAGATLGAFGSAVALLPQDVRVDLQARAEHWRALPPASRARLHAGLQAWDRVDARERMHLRAAHAAWRGLPEGERTRVRAAAAAFAVLDPARQAELRAQFERLDGSERHGWLLGPDLGRDYPRLQPLLAQVPPDEHDGVLRALRAMTPVQRDMLATLVQRTPPGGRAALRAELAATSSAQRDAWLWQRLGP